MNLQKKNGYELYKLYADEGISGKQIKNTENNSNK